MTILSVQNLRMDFGEKNVFSGVSFDVNEGDAVGLIGANGTGKTTLFKILTGALECTAGQVVISKFTRLGYLEQHACENSHKTVYDEALTVFSSLISDEKRLEEIAALLETDSSARQELIDEQSHLNDKFISDGGLVFRSKTMSALKGMGFADNEIALTCDKLSGGQKSKLSMCKLLLSEPDLLLLDEPTNHLDISGSEWLESFLSDYKGSIVVISHDRYFLDKICNKTVEISNNTAYSVKGNYSEYIKAREARIESEKRQYANQIAEIKRIEGIIEQQRSFARERNFITAESKRKMLERKKSELVSVEKSADKIRLSFTPQNESGNDVLFASGLSKSYGEKHLFSDCTFNVYKGDRVFIIGSNGCGKTTLLRILTGKETADSGFFRFGTGVKTGYFDQSLGALRGNGNVLDEIWNENRLMSETQVRNYLAMFLFKGNDVYKSVRSLSGGEKAKLCLLKLMLSGANVLLLDEPTNHLDIPSREILENALAEYEGTIISVSHDRYFINKLADKIFIMKNGGVKESEGDYDDYCSAVLSEKPAKESRKSPVKNDYKLRKERESEINRLRGKIKRLEAQSADNDAEIEKLNSLLESPEVASDYEKITEISDKIHTLSLLAEELLNEWEQCSERLDELQSGEE